jgi:hypothetical protein
MELARSAPFQELTPQFPIGAEKGKGTHIVILTVSSSFANPKLLKNSGGITLALCFFMNAIMASSISSPSPKSQDLRSVFLGKEKLTSGVETESHE